MSTPAKTAGTNVLTVQQLASNSVLVSSVLDVSTKFSANYFIHLGRDDTGGALTEGVRMRIEGSAKASGDDQWMPVAEYVSVTDLPEAEALTGTISAAATNLTMASTTNLNIFDIILIKNTTIGNSEFARIRKVNAGASVDIIDGLTNAQTGATIYNKGEMWSPSIDCLALTRLRLVIDASNTGRSIVVQAQVVTCDSIG